MIRGTSPSKTGLPTPAGPESKQSVAPSSETATSDGAAPTERQVHNTGTESPAADLEREEARAFLQAADAAIAAAVNPNLPKLHPEDRQGFVRAVQVVADSHSRYRVKVNELGTLPDAILTSKFGDLRSALRAQLWPGMHLYTKLTVQELSEVGAALTKLEMGDVAGNLDHERRRVLRSTDDMTTWDGVLSNTQQRFELLSDISRVPENDHLVEMRKFLSDLVSDLGG